MNKNKIYISLFIIVGTLVSIWSVRTFLLKRQIDQQKNQIQKSYTGLQSYNKNYFKCNSDSIKHLESYIKNHELKIYNLIALDQSLMFDYINDWDELKESLEKQIEQCKASLP